MPRCIGVNRRGSKSEPLKNIRVDPNCIPSVLAEHVSARSFMKLRTATFAAAVLVAAVSPNLSTTAQARPFGFHGGFGHGGWGHGGWGHGGWGHGGWGHGGWGWGGVGAGLATGAIIGAALAAPYYGAYGYDYGYAPAYGFD